MCKRAHVEMMLFDSHGDERGQLIALETMTKNLPFEVRRCYYIFDTIPGIDRGRHAHRELRQLLVCVSGGCTVECETPDGKVSTHRLDWPNKGLIVEGLVWRVMKQFTKGAVLMVLASDHYAESDYIRDYDEFKRVCAEGVP